MTSHVVITGCIICVLTSSGVTLQKSHSGLHLFLFSFRHEICTISREQDHKFCTDANRKELLAEKLDRLRALKDEIAKNEWMFEGR